MKLSEAIRLGAMWSPHGIDGWMDGTARCALAGAAETVGIKPVQSFDYMTNQFRTSIDYGEMLRQFPILSETANQPCGCDDRTDHLVVECTIMHLNDQCGWTREQIADWVETIEAQHEQQQQQPEQVHVTAG